MSCLFCQLIREDSTQWVARGPSACAFTPLDPLAPGHTLVVPTAHYADVFDTPIEVLAETVELVQLLARAMRSGLNATGVNVLNASGPGSEQSVRHLHFHVVPRWPDDGISTWPTGQSQHRFAGDPAVQLADALTVGEHPRS
ncbi:HIT domain-containing protein [Streptomyces sp. NPDC048417]|uniref:HIT family protein n=1 Tax=Streptomyces sp. NPDC048417 TaxID=3155387 RepID=UPI0034208A53